jgi:hypothetical protein
MQKTLHSVASVSFIFFVVFGIIHIVSSFLVAQDVIDNTTWLIFNVLDLPFLLAGLTFGTARISLALGRISNNYKVPLIICTALSIVLFLIALYFNFLIPDAQLLP